MPSAYNSDVTVTIEAAFGYDPYTTPTWTEITSDVRAFSTVRGRSHVLDDMQAGKAQIMLTNTSGDYSPWNTAGSYSPNVRVFTPIRIRATHNLVTYDLFRGFVEAWPNTWPGMKDATVTIDCIDAFRLFAMHEAEFTESEEASGTRIGNLLDTTGWPAGWRSLDTGTHIVAAVTSEFDSVLGEIKRVVLVEDGQFWIGVDGNAVFKDGSTKIQDTTVQATFSDDGADSPYADIQIDYDEQQMWNAATVTRVGGIAQPSSLSASIADFGRRDLHLSETLHIADGEAKSLASWMVQLNAAIRPRVSAVTIIPEASPSQLWPEVLGLDFWEKVNVERTDITGDSLDADCWVEGISHTVTMTGGRSWSTTFQLSADLPYSDWWILGTSELGTDTRLGY